MNWDQTKFAVDRPDVTARVFRLKQQQLLQDIKSGVLGKVIAHVNTFEFQKRGLPHCHFLCIIQNNHDTWQEIDEVVSAELPHPNTPKTTDLDSLVMKHMFHGPYGERNYNSPCMVDGQCSKHYPPRDFRTQTLSVDDCFPLYCR